MGKAKSKEEKIKIMQDKLGSDYEVIWVRTEEGKINKNGKKNANKDYYTIRHLCDYCGNELVEVRADKCKKGKICPICDTKYTKNEIVIRREIKEAVGDEYILLGDYNGNKEKIQLLHTECWTTEYYVTPEKFLQKDSNGNYNGNRCNKCGKLRKYEESEIKDIVHKASDYEYSLLGKYNGYSSKNAIVHNTCGFIWDITMVNLLKGPRENKEIKHGCPLCEGNLKGNTDWFIERVKIDVGDEYTVLPEMAEYENNSTEMYLQHNCDKCNNNIWKVRPDNFFMGERCPICQRGIQESKDERKVREYIEDELDFETYTKEESVRILGNKDIDILLKCNIGFEYNGDYWHKEVENPNEVRGGKPIDYHKNKIREAKDNGIILYHIWERDWKKRPDHVKKFIKNAINMHMK